MVPETAQYNVPLAFALDGELDLDRLKRALRRVIETNAALRLRVTVDGLKAIQGEWDIDRFDLVFTDLTALDATARDETASHRIR